MKQVSLNIFRLFSLAALAFSLTFFTACNETPQEEAEDAMEEVDDELTMEQEDYRNRITEWNDKIDAEIEELEEEMEEAEEAAKQEYQEQIQTLRSWKTNLDGYAQDFETNVEQGWDNFRMNLDQTFNTIETEYDGWDS